MKESMFTRWAMPLASTLPLTDLENSMGDDRPLKLGFDAEYYLQRFSGKEPLNGALGGDPYLLEDKIMLELDQFRKLNCQLLFFFHGCEFGPSSGLADSSMRAADINKSAFSKYEENSPKEAIEIFKVNDFPDIAPLLAWFKMILAKHNIPFITSPFSAYAQMVDSFNQSSIDMYFASTEIFLYGAGQIIAGFDIKVETYKTVSSGGEEVNTSSINVEASSFRLLDLEVLASAHIHAPEGLVRDAMILAGSSKLPTFQPWVDAAANPSFSFANAAALLMHWEGNVYGLIESSAIEGKTNYWEQYMQTATAIQYMPVLYHINEVVPAGRRKDIPGDLQTALGLHLPDELNYYLSTGIIEPKMLNWLNSGKISVPAPFAGGDDLYKQVVKDTLHGWRKQNYSLLVTILNRYFQKRPVTTEYFFESSTDNAFTDEPAAVDTKLLAPWRVREKAITGRASALEASPCSLDFALRSLSDETFAAATKEAIPKDRSANPLVTTDEIVCNSIWRCLSVRGYVDKDHKLSPWGKVASAALAKVGSTREQSEAVFVAIELLHAKVFSPSVLFAGHEQDSTDRKYTDFIAKLMCVGSLAHQPKGYSGPLSRSLLAFHASVLAIRSSLRDLLEATLVNLLLFGDSERVRDDYQQLAQDLPFRGRNTCGLGIFISTYLDQYHERVTECSSAAELHESLKSRMQLFVAHSLVDASYERINQIWDAFMTAVRAAEDLVDVDERKQYEEIDAWFARRRPGTASPLLANGV